MPAPMVPAPTTATGAALSITGWSLCEVNVVVVEWLAVDAVARRCDPCGNLAPLVHRLHQGPNVCLVHVRGQPLALAALPLLGRDLLAVRGGLDPGERADLAVEGDVRQLQPLPDASLLQDAVPPLDAALAVRDVLAAQVGVEADQRRDLRLPDALLARPGVLGQRVHHDRVAGQLVVVLAPVLQP